MAYIFAPTYISRPLLIPRLGKKFDIDRHHLLDGLQILLGLHNCLFELLHPLVGNPLNPPLTLVAERH